MFTPQRYRIISANTPPAKRLAPAPDPPHHGNIQPHGWFSSGASTLVWLEMKGSEKFGLPVSTAKPTWQWSRNPQVEKVFNSVSFSHAHTLQTPKNDAEVFNCCFKNVSFPVRPMYWLLNETQICITNSTKFRLFQYRLLSKASPAEPQKAYHPRHSLSCPMVGGWKAGGWVYSLSRLGGTLLSCPWRVPLSWKGDTSCPAGGVPSILAGSTSPPPGRTRGPSHWKGPNTRDQGVPPTPERTWNQIPGGTPPLLVDRHTNWEYYLPIKSKIQTYAPFVMLSPSQQNIFSSVVS